MEGLGKRVIAAVNADFFHFFHNGDKTTFGAQIIDGVVHKEPNNAERYGENWFGVTYDGEYVLSDLEAYESTYKGKLYQAVGGGVWLVREHRFCPHSSPAEEPRTAVGITDDGGLVLVCVDGRSQKSVGATYADLTQVFLDLPVPIRSVLNLDGGHSTILMGRRPVETIKILNNPSSGLEALRPVADILTLVLQEEAK
jgi:exopolysaccharide biosynthesis protein